MHAMANAAISVLREVMEASGAWVGHSISKPSGFAKRLAQRDEAPPNSHTLPSGR
jgi:hypothetical protein